MIRIQTSRDNKPNWSRPLAVSALAVVGLTIPALTATHAVRGAELSLEQKAVEARLLADAARNAEKHRKGTVTIQVRDAAQQPVPNVAVQVQQTQHEFLFGCIAFSLVRNRPDEQLDLFRNRFAELFNFAVLPFYWAGYEGQPGQTVQQPTADVVRWCQQHDIVVKGHPLVWANRAGVPNWVRARPEDTRFPLALQRVRREARGFAGQIEIWDVVNEAVNMRPWDDFNSRDYLQAPIEKIVPYVEQSFQAAHAANPKAHLILNEFNLIPRPDVRQRFHQLVQELKRRDTPISGLGIQAHEPRSEWFPPEQVVKTLDRLASLGLALHITEFIPQSGGKQITGGWRQGTWDETAQADFAEQMYRLAFGHPQVVSINWWGLSDRRIWQPKGGLVDENYQPKLVYKRLQKLIHDEWTTRVATRTDANGSASVRGFFGKYKVTVTGTDGKVQTFDCVLKKGAEMRWTLVLTSA